MALKFYLEFQENQIDKGISWKIQILQFCREAGFRENVGIFAVYKNINV